MRISENPLRKKFDAAGASRRRRASPSLEAASVASSASDSRAASLRSRCVHHRVLLQQAAGSPQTPGRLP